MSDPRKFKGDISVEGNLRLPNETASRVLVVDGSGEIASSATTTTELSYLEGVTSSVQDQIDAAQADADQALLDAAAAQDAIDDHIALATDAHDASSISVTATGNLVSTDVQAALEELQDDIDLLAAIDPMEYKGNWNASTNSPSLTDGTGNNGDLYNVSVAGTQFTPSIVFAIGDKVVYNGATAKYEKWDIVDPASTDELPEGVTNLYFTDERAQDAVGSILVDSNTIDFTYSDATPSISAAVKTQMSITSDASGIKLDGDEATPGNTQYYGTDGSGVKGFHPIPAVGSAGDIQETSFSAANNVASAANVTGFAFAAGTVRSFSALVSVAIDATADLYEQFTLQGINKNGSFSMSVDSVGDSSGIVFSITSAGQVQYTSTNVAGFSTNTIKFRALTTTV